MRPFSLLILMTALLASPVGFAEEVSLPDVIIRASSDVSPAESVVTSPIRTKDYSGRIVTVGEVLEEQAGIHLTRYGGLDDSTSISIRGSEADEVNVYYDGIPLNTAQGNGVDLSLILLENLDSITVDRGGEETVGFFPSAGSVFLESAKIPQRPKSVFSAGYGSFNTAKGEALVTSRSELFGFLASVGYSRTSGNFTFLDDNGTPVNPADDQRVERRNNESQTIHPFFKLSYDFDDKTSLEWLGHLLRKDSGVPGLSANQSDEANLSHTGWLSGLTFRRKGFFHPQLNFESQIYFRLVKNQYSDLNGEIGLGGAQDNDDDTTIIGLKNVWELRAGGHQMISFPLTYQMERFRPENFLLADPTGGSSVRHSFSGGVKDEIDFLGGRVVAVPMIQYEHVSNRINNDDPSFLTPATFVNNRDHNEWAARLGIRGKIASFALLEGNIFRGFRFPTFSELFGDRGGVVGNPFLDPQKSLNWDAGFLVKQTVKKGIGDRGRLRVFYFERRVNDLIQFEQNAGFARAENVGKATIRGVELESGVHLFEHVALLAAYTFQRALDEGNRRILPGHPEHELFAKVEGWVKPVKMTTTVQWQDDTFLDPLNTRRVNDRVILNSGLSVQVTKRVEAAFEAKNLTNGQIVDVVGFPLPGRSFFGRVRITL